ncbi:tannase/feruloyl esterase family alpha/beta hydrolase [Granulicella tundricola]|uniref:Tannase and feruloyl esterase n=1 Tax=Granulicella tundricola (strain ATCC BAA-1859 / DSM 23138 / MP5ACTX9) TaxID=1198114 RepID=E8WXF9_GRATM|nr:tannase/feruloyl esterase family alpha/beta hydrolase [Granulicella tundricola]ADW67492.1 Tannase and feruloyl esterase [Granulicella tundricola MP5ACTX9]
MRSILIPLALLISSAAAHAATCASLAALSLPDTTITHAEAVPPGPLKPPYGDPIASLPAFCRVTGILRPTPDSEIRFEVWLPEKEAPKGKPAWNHRLLDVGNGGFAGTIAYGQMASNLRKGYATAGTDTGHQAEAEDASWAYHHPEKIKDFGYRALHLTTQRAKTILAAYYGEPQKKAYFDACSDGGREALMEAQRFPEDYDGILAGAPANNWTGLLSAGVDVSHTVIAHPEGYISSFKLRAINTAVLNACDAQDGLKDGLLNDPRTCHFDPATLLCKSGDELTCLTAPQVASLSKIYAGGHDSTGNPIFPGLMPGGEADWRDWITGGGPSESRYMLNFFRYMVYDDPAWSPLAAAVDASVRTAHEKMAEPLNATNPDLAPFIAHGGKLLLYHGWNDPAISPLNTIAYYQQVVAKVGPAQAEAAVKLYMVPGMGHCAGGPGPSGFGQIGLPSPGAGAIDQLQDWVETGKAPTSIIAAKYTADRKIQMTRPLCPYPQLAQYTGKGSTEDSTNFTCAAPPQ